MEGEQCNFHSQTLCEDCYVGAIQRPKACDVWSVHSAKTSRAMAGQTGTDGLTDTQKKLYNTIKEAGKITRPELIKRLAIPDWELEKQFAVLRHCELIKARKEGDQVFIMLFETQ
ncbi:MAG: hypothetical protein ACYC2T_04165 [Bacillota bacterium]